MKVLIDTNVVLDAIANRIPYKTSSQEIINLILDNKLEGYITANCTTDIYYIARKHLNQIDLQNTMRSLFSVFRIIDVLETDCHTALDSSLSDYEDALMVVCGTNVSIDYLISRDEELLQSKAVLPVISPIDFLNKFKEEGILQ